MTKGLQMEGYLRSDGRKGVRNIVAIVYLVECAHHVCREIALDFRHEDVHVIGFPGCYRNDYAYRMMLALCCHPNVGAVLLVSLGCEGFDRRKLAADIAASGRPVECLTIQETGGTARTIQTGGLWVRNTRSLLDKQAPVPMEMSDLVIGTICGGSDGTSGLTANPAVGRAFDQLISGGAACIFEETGELIGCEEFMYSRAATSDLKREVETAMIKAARYYAALGQSSIEQGNADGGLTTIEEKSLGAYAKSGQSEIVGLIKPADRPVSSGLYLLDIVPDGDVRFGFPNINDNAEIAELIACGSQIILFTTGRGSVVGSAISPVIKICANPDTYRRMQDDMDVDAGRILEGGGQFG